MTKAQPRDAIDEMTLEELAGPQVEYTPPEKPILTRNKVRNVVADLIDMANQGGYAQIARKRKIWRRQVRRIDRLRLRRIAELTPDPDLEPEA